MDGVGLLADGRRVYFAFPRSPFGAMAEISVVDGKNWTLVPDDVDDVTAAAIANPGMSSWAALTDRAQLQPRETVLINGAAGASGRLAIQIARFMGAGTIIATARNPTCFSALRALGADLVIALGGDARELTEHFHAVIGSHQVTVVLDYLWGPSAECLLTAASGHAGIQQPRIRYVQIGSLACPTINFSGAILRSSGLELMGSGLGSVSNAGLVRAAGGVFSAVSRAGLVIETKTVSLASVESEWTGESSARVVFTSL